MMRFHARQADVDEYLNPVTKLLGNFLPKEAERPPSVVDAIDFGAPKRRSTDLAKLSRDLDAALSQREWFVTGNVDPTFFDPGFSFQDPDVKLTGIKKYAEGVNKLFQQGTTRGEIISCVVNDTRADTITVTWRLEGRVNLGPQNGIPIKAFIVYSDLVVNPASGLVVFQEDRFSLPGWDIILSAFFPKLPFLAPPAPAVVRRSSPRKKLQAPTRRGDQLGGDAASRALFSLTEAFAKILQPRTYLKLPSNTVDTAGSNEASGRTTAEMQEILRQEYEKLFWVTGSMDMDLWEEDCVFSDPFSSFGGPGSSARFQRNAKALGGLVLNPQGSVTNVEVVEDVDGEGDVVKIGWAFTSKLKLPWRPVLAAAGETSHYLTPRTSKIFKYEERWKSKPLDVVRRLAIPTK